MHKEESRQKTRNQSLFEYLEALQIEYLQAEIRLKIYPKTKDKKFWKKVLLHKESKIKDIASRNSLPHIFDEVSIRDRYRSQIVNSTGMPSFSYKDEADREEFLIKDFRYYFNRDSEVRVLVGGGEVSVGTISEAPELGQASVGVKVRGDQNTTMHAIEHVTRIL